jgi:hypothetical protein
MDTMMYSTKPKLSTLSESIFSIGDEGEVKIGGKTIPYYECSIRSTYSGIGYQLKYDGYYMGGYHRNEIDVFTTINNHEKYLEELNSIECEIEELKNNLYELESQTFNNTEIYYNLVGEEIDYEDLESNILEIKILLEREENNLTNWKNKSLLEWNL